MKLGGKYNYLRLGGITLLMSCFLFVAFVYAFPVNPGEEETPGATRYLKLDVNPGLGIEAVDMFVVGQEYSCRIKGNFPPLTLKVSNNKLSLRRIDPNTFSIQAVETGPCILILTDSKGHKLQKTVEIRHH